MESLGKRSALTVANSLHWVTGHQFCTSIATVAGKKRSAIEETPNRPRPRCYLPFKFCIASLYYEEQKIMNIASFLFLKQALLHWSVESARQHLNICIEVFVIIGNQYDRFTLNCNIQCNSELWYISDYQPAILSLL
jgi:hypothetical protein